VVGRGGFPLDALALAPGDVVTLSGVVEDYFGTPTLRAVAADVTGSASVPAPIPLDAVDAADDAYAAVLVVVDGTVTALDFDCGGDTGCEDHPSLWEIGGTGGVLVADTYYEGADYADHVGEVPVTGIIVRHLGRW